MTADGHFRVPTPVNEPIRPYAPGDASRKSLKSRLAELTDARTEVPSVARRNADSHKRVVFEGEIQRTL